MSAFQVFVGNHTSSVRHWGIHDIKDIELEQPNEEHPDFSKLVVTTFAPTSHNFFFVDNDVAGKAFADITAAKQTGESVELHLKEDINKHLLHPNLQ